MSRRLWPRLRDLVASLPVALGLCLAPSAKAQPITIELISPQPGAPISDLVYGINEVFFGPHHSALPYPLRRWGGNHTSRYNWRINSWNAGKDWYYLNVPAAFGKAPGAGSQPWSYTDRLIHDQAAAGRDVIITVPMLGWVAKSREPAWGYSVRKYGRQQAAEHAQSNGDAGNGVLPGGLPLLRGNPSDTSVAAPPAFVADWVKHNSSLVTAPLGRPAVRFYALDNEPFLWHDTHQDLRYGDRQLAQPELGYDELWERTVAYAGAIKASEPKAQILGPVGWSRCDMISSARDHCRAGADRRAHGGQPFLRWYLRQVCAQAKKTGVRLVDYLDVHYYPPDEPDPNDESAAARHRRLAAPLALYDREFNDGDGSGAATRLVPRLREWLHEDCAGLGLAISEYRFGSNPQSMSAAMANAEALAIFGREGVDLAAYWGSVPSGSLLEDAFRLFLNYDGNGASALGGRTLVLTSSSPMLAVYGIATAKRDLIYIFNKSDLHQNVALANGLNGRVSGPGSRRFLWSQATGLSELKTDGKAINVPRTAVLLLEGPAKGP